MLSDYFAHKAMLQAGALEMTEAFKATGLHDAMYAIPILAAAGKQELMHGPVPAPG
jgi:hypothetical protein